MLRTDWRRFVGAISSPSRGMMVISGDVAINGRASGRSWSLRAYPPWAKRRDAFGSRYGSSLVNIQYGASTRCRATAPIAFA
jgi:hypothetical protein